MADFGQLTGRQYKLMEYYGSPTAKRVMVVLASAEYSIRDIVD